MKLRFFLLAMIFVVITGGTTLKAEQIEIKVDGSKKMGTVPDVFSSSVWMVKANNRYQIERFFNENNPRIVHFTIDLLLPNTKSFEEYKQKLKNEFFNPSGGPYFLAQQVKKENAYLIIGLDPYTMPSWLSARKGDHRGAFTHEEWWTIEQLSPPQDYSLWGDVVYFTLKFLRDDLGVKKTGFYVGHEPNWLWFGSEESLFKYYEYAAKAAKKLGKDVLVGGLGAWDLMAKKEGCDYETLTPAVKELCKKEGNWTNPKGEPLLKSFIEYIAKHNVPLDFINWHTFSHDPHQFMEDGKTARQWLKDKKLDQVKLFVSDWTYWAGWPYPDDYLDTEETASNVLVALSYMHKGGIDWQGHDFDIFVDAHESDVIKKRRNAEFIGDWPIFTRNNIVKPVYNALKALSMVTGEKGNQSPKLLDVKVSDEDIGIAALSTLKDDEIALIVSNFVPQQQRFRPYLFKRLKKKANFDTADLKVMKECASAQTGRNKKDVILSCMEKFSRTTNDELKKEKAELFSKIYACSNEESASKISSCIKKSALNVQHSETKEIASFLSDTLKQSAAPTSLKINFMNLPFRVDSNATVYVIDKNHSNACRLNKKTEPSPSDTPCGIGGKVDKAVWQAEAESKKNAVRSVANLLISKRYSKEQIQQVKNSVAECKDARGKGKCLKEKLTSIGLKKTDLEDSIKVFKDDKQKMFFEETDKINHWDEISLEGSKRIEKLNTHDTIRTLNLTMEPNAIYVIVLKKK